MSMNWAAQLKAVAATQPYRPQWKTRPALARDSIPFSIGTFPQAFRGAKPETDMHAKLLGLMVLTATFLTLSPVMAEPDGNACYDNKTDPASLKSRIAGCTQLLAANPASNEIANIYLNRGIARRKLGQNAAAEADYSQVIHIEPMRFDAFNGRCFARALQGKLQPALVDCNKALKISPNDPYTLDTRGYVNLRLGNYDAAIADYDDAIAQEKFPESYFGRGVAKLRLGNKTGGNADIALAKQIDPQMAATMARLGIKP
jgi:tetratricopeptide (TPR) repeat protein